MKSKNVSAALTTNVSCRLISCQSRHAHQCGSIYASAHVLSTGTWKSIYTA